MTEQQLTPELQTPTGKAKVFSRIKKPKPIRLTARDAAVLEALWRHRCLSREQLRRLVFQCSPSMVRRRLRALYDHNLVERVPVAAVPTRNIPPFLYTLSRSGAELLPDLLAHYLPDLLPESEGSSRICGLNGAGLRFVQHRFLVNEFHVTLAEAVRRRRYLLTWRHEEDLNIVTGNGRRRSETITHSLLPEPMSFLPDGYFELQLPNGDSFAYFVEVDMATHAQRVWRERALLYSAYADQQAGLFRRRFGRQAFRLLIVTTADYRRRSRCDNILRSIQATVGSSDMFLATTFPEVTAERLLGPIWRRADGSRRRNSLVENERLMVTGTRSAAATARQPARVVASSRQAANRSA